MLLIPRGYACRLNQEVHLRHLRTISRRHTLRKNAALAAIFGGDDDDDAE